MKHRIKQIRSELQLTQQEFADNLNIKRSTIATYETGAKPLPDRTIADICTVYHVNESWLRTGEGAMFQEPKAIDLAINAEVAKLLGDQNADEWVKRMLLELLRLPPESQRACRDFLKRTLLEEEVK